MPLSAQAEEEERAAAVAAAAAAAAAAEAQALARTQAAEAMKKKIAEDARLKAEVRFEYMCQKVNRSPIW